MSENSNDKVNSIDRFLITFSNFISSKWKQITGIIVVLLIASGAWFTYYTLEEKKFIQEANDFFRIKIKLQKEINEIDEIDENAFLERQLELYTEFLENKPHYTLYNEVQLAIGEIQNQLKKYQEAIETYQQIYDDLEDQTLRTLVLFKIVKLHESLGEFEKASDLLNQSDVGQYGDLKVYQNGVLELLKNNPEEAKKHFNELSKNYANSPIKFQVDELLKIL